MDYRRIADAIKLSSMGYDAVSLGQANLTDYQIYLIDKYFGKDVTLTYSSTMMTIKLGKTKVSQQPTAFGSLVSGILEL